VIAKTIECTAILPNGQPCGHIAVILAAGFEYDAIILNGQGVQHVLRRTHYEIECPNCALRTQTVEAKK
jgi:hypothetical protein